MNAAYYLFLSSNCSSYSFLRRSSSCFARLSSAYQEKKIEIVSLFKTCHSILQQAIKSFKEMHFT